MVLVYYTKKYCILYVYIHIYIYICMTLIENDFPVEYTSLFPSVF